MKPLVVEACAINWLDRYCAYLAELLHWQLHTELEWAR